MIIRVSTRGSCCKPVLRCGGCRLGAREAVDKLLFALLPPRANRATHPQIPAPRGPRSTREPSLKSPWPFSWPTFLLSGNFWREAGVTQKTEHLEPDPLCSPALRSLPAPPSGSPFTSLSLGFFLCKMGATITLPHRTAGRSSPLCRGPCEVSSELRGWAPWSAELALPGGLSGVSKLPSLFWRDLQEQVGWWKCQAP